MEKQPTQTQDRKQEHDSMSNRALSQNTNWNCSSKIK